MSKTVYVVVDGEEIFLDLSVNNNSDNAAPNTVVQVVYPASLTYKSHAVSTGTYNATTKKWTIASLPAHSARLLTLELEVTDVTLLPLEVTWSATSSGGDVDSDNDDCGVWTVAAAPSSTADDCTAYPVSGNVLCGNKVACGCCDKTFSLDAGSIEGISVSINAETGDYYGHAVSETGYWSFRWLVACECDDEDDTTEYGPFTITNAGSGHVDVVQTEDATATNIPLFVTESNRVYEVDYTVRASSGTDNALYRRLLRVKNVSNVLTVLQEVTIGTDYEDAGLTAASVVGAVSSTSIVVTVTGIAVTDIDWEIEYKVRLW